MTLKAWIVGAMALVLGTSFVAAATPKATSPDISRFQPDCARDTACEIWKQFRRNHPFPVQEIAAGRAADSLVLIFSEPSVPKEELQLLVKRAFGADLREQSVRRWMTGEDGWLEDLVVTVRWQAAKEGANAAVRAAGKGAAKAAQADPLDDTLLRDRLSLIAQRLWGTAFGLQVDSATLPFEPRARASAPNLDPHPNELREWLQDPQLTWRPIAGGSAQRTFPELAGAAAGGAYASSDSQLTLLQLTRADIERARSDPAAFANQWRAPFRHFAVATDTVLGAAWLVDGGIGFVGRVRRVGADVMAPLRFETFALLAGTGASTLAQSYERTTPLAGKMGSGRHAGADWAPIYLSRQLIDTEFGALLNITDQMLKSWSMAGEIDYLYFDYPMRPVGKRFAFGETPLSDLVRRETGSTQVLFNWNTSGSAAVVSRARLDVLTPTQTGALPITYGAEISPGSGMKFGNQIESLRRHERDAYGYFSGLRDPNLARVVSYTLIYQSFQALARQQGSVADDGDPRIAARDAAMKSLAGDLSQVLTELSQPDAARRIVESERVAAEKARGRKIVLDVLSRASYEHSVRMDLEKIRHEIAGIRSIDPRYAQPQTLAALLIGYRTEQRLATAALDARWAAFDAKVKEYNSSGKVGRMTLPNRAELEATNAQLKADSKKLDELLERTSRLHGLLGPVVANLRELDEVRSRFVAASAATAAGWIKTPTVVISRNSRVATSVGGHSLNSRALRIEVDPSATEASLVEAGGIRTLKVPPSQADEAGARANDLARQIEHGKADITSIRSALAESRAPAMQRTRLAALQGDKPGDFRAIAGRSGSEPLSDSVLRDQMLALYDGLGDGVASQYVGMARREANGDFLVLSRVGGRTECCVRVRDLATFRDRLMDWKGQGDVALVDFEPAQARALARNLNGRDDAAMLEAVGGGRGGEPPNGTVSFISGNGGEPPRDMGSGGAGGNNAGNSGNGAGKGGGTGGGGKPPPSSPGQNDPMMVAMLVDHGQPLEVRAMMAKPRVLQRIGEPLEGAQAELELQGLQRAAKREAGRQRLGWDPVRDGKPVVFRLKFIDVDPTVPGLEARVIAGVDPLRAPVGIKLVKESIDAARGARPRGSLFDLQARVKDLVDRSPDRATVKRLLTHVTEARSSFMMSRADPSGRGGAPA
jgi:hypothetical protein